MSPGTAVEFTIIPSGFKKPSLKSAKSIEILHKELLQTSFHLFGASDPIHTKRTKKPFGENRPRGAYQTCQVHLDSQAKANRAPRSILKQDPLGPKASKFEHAVKIEWD